ncbi:hypothetical protein AC579_8377 [Pseudocercospora musae]|uniref:Prokaryotic-type class I peptide chain release factors domain-containing protein n=1 Tax=Pseudocercospora musae TaxID=113226 RepID=A0A139III5_9PEZI|nr:hypothetical protein AC579_8377 [Pseudocercospora musae]
MTAGIGQLSRTFSVQQVLQEKPLPPRMVIPETDIEESFLKGTGPGGQKINKTSSAVQLKHLPTGIVVKNQATRSREQNRKNARRILGERLEEMEKGALSRTALKAGKEKKKKASASKKARRKYRKLDEAKAGNKSEHDGIEDGLDASSDSAQDIVNDDVLDASPSDASADRKS